MEVSELLDLKKDLEYSIKKLEEQKETLNTELADLDPNIVEQYKGLDEAGLNKVSEELKEQLLKFKNDFYNIKKEAGI